MFLIFSGVENVTTRPVLVVSHTVFIEVTNTPLPIYSIKEAGNVETVVKPHTTAYGGCHLYKEENDQYRHTQ